MFFCRKLRTCAECGVVFERDNAKIRPDLCRTHRRPFEERAALEHRLFEWMRENLQTFKDFYDHSWRQEYERRAEHARQIGHYGMGQLPTDPGVWLTKKNYEPERVTDSPTQ